MENFNAHLRDFKTTEFQLHKNASSFKEGEVHIPDDAHLHTCIRRYRTEEGHVFEEGKSYPRRDEPMGELNYAIFMTTASGEEVRVSMQHYEEHFMFDSDAEIAAQGNYNSHEDHPDGFDFTVKNINTKGTETGRL